MRSATAVATRGSEGRGDSSTGGAYHTDASDRLSLTSHAMAAPDTAFPSIDLGDCLVTPFSAGTIKLDGGAMFGIIPKALWSRLYPADEHNRIHLACNSLLVEPRGSGRRIIVETGPGAKFSEKEQRLYGIDPSRWLLPSLRLSDQSAAGGVPGGWPPALGARPPAGLDPGSITDVVLTHLHFDHAGGLTCVDGDERLQRTFPNAAVHVQRAEFDDARANHGIMTVTYREENFSPIDEAGLWRLHDGDAQIAPCVRVAPAPGHTRGQQAVFIEGTARTLVYIGDVMPTRHHLGPAYNMAYDLYPLDNRATKERLLGWIADHAALLALDHDPDTPVVRVRRAGRWFELDAIGARDES